MSHENSMSVDWFTTGWRGPGRSLTAAATLTDSDDVVFCSAAGGAFTVTLPTAVGRLGRRFTIIKTETGANAITIAASGGQVQGGASQTIPGNARGGRVLRSDGTDWWYEASY